MTLVLILAVALSMDAFAVSIGLGIKAKNDIKKVALKAGIFFGVFQSLMPLIGYYGGEGLKTYIGEYNHVIAFILLTIVGIKMIYEAFEENVEDEISMVSNKIMLTLAIATSVDAMAAGFTLHLFNLNVYLSLFIIGVVTFILSIAGVIIGSKGGIKYEKKAEIFGGGVLIIIGLKIILEHIVI